MKISITAKAVNDDQLGRLVRGTVVDLPQHKALFYLKRNEAEMYQTKVMRDRPYPVAGTTEPPSASPVDHPSPKQTLTSSEDGEKKKARPKKEPSSSPTPPSE